MDNQRGNIEVSLPGAGESEPTILEVINRNTITNSETESQIETETETTSPQSQQLENITEEDTEKFLLNKSDITSNNIESKTLTTEEELHKIAKDTLGNISLNNNENIEEIDSGNILDIESHLIETFENFSVSEESGVAIRECQPAKEEYKRISQIETETSPKTVIEIEPSIPKTLKPIELDLDINIKKQFGVETTETINDTIPINLKEQNNKFIASEQANEINNLISHIEEKKDDYTKIVDSHRLQDLNQKDLIKENITLDCPSDPDNGIGINGLQNCITPLEEEEKKKLLDSLPQLDENDSNNLSIQAKKEYYQLLRDYLDKHQDDRPPIPLKTYRWEDLRRAKEKGGYPWTHLYKRPLGPEEEPEIVLLLRKSQEFRFSSESPKSLKKVRIHDQVLVKETERYINDLSDTEDNPDVTTENIKNIEDNHSINSESAASLTSDSVAKKSKLSKLKGILKRRSSTNETKLNSPNKSSNKKTDTNADGVDKKFLHSESDIPCKTDSVSEDKKSKLDKLKGLVKRQNIDANNKKPKESTSIFYSDNFEDKTIGTNESIPVAPIADKSKFDKLIDTVKGEKTIESKQIDEKEISLLSNPVKSNSSQSETATKEDNHSIHSESAIFGLSDSGVKKSKLSKLKGFVRRRTGDKTQDDTKSVQSESALSRKSDSASVGKQSKFKKLQGAFKIRKFAKEDQSKLPENSENNPSKEDTHSVQSESELPESVNESKKFSKLQGLIKVKSDNKKKETEQEDTKSVNSESAVSSKSDSTLERKKIKLSKLKGIFKGKQDNESQKPEEIDKSLTDLGELTSPDVPYNSESQQKKSKLLTLKEIFKGKQESESKKAEETEKTLTDLDDPISPDVSSTKSDSTLERKKSKLSNLKGIFKSKQDSDNQKPEEIEIKLTDLDEPTSPDTEETQSTQSELQSSTALPETKPTKLKKLKGIVKHRSAAKKPRTKKNTSPDEENSTEDINSKSEDSPKKEKCCQPIMDKLKTLTDKQFKKRNIKKVTLKDQEKIVLEEEQKILKLRESPKAVRGEIPKFVEKQDSEDLLEIVQLEESPSQKRKEPTSSILIPDEIIEISSHTVKVQERQNNDDPSITPEPTVTEILEAELKSTPPVKALRKIKAHIYEDIENNESTIEMKIDEILQLASVEALKKSLAAQDQNILKDIESNKKIPLDRMGSSEEEIEKTTISNDKNHLAPISSIDSASSDEQEKRTQLSSVTEESEICSTDGKDIIIIEDNNELDLKSALKREPSPSPSIGDKKVTFSHVEDDAEPHREDIEIPEELKGMPNRWSTMK